MWHGLKPNLTQKPTRFKLILFLFELKNKNRSLITTSVMRPFVINLIDDNNK